MLRRLALLSLLTAAIAGVTVRSKSMSTERRLNQLTAQLGLLNFEALAQFQSKTNTAFLATLSILPSQTTGNAGGASNDGNTGPYWASGERGFINTNSSSITGLANAVNNLQTNLKACGFELP